jgi:hypothetical protein
MTTIAIVALVGAIVGAITFIGVFIVARDQIEARTRTGTRHLMVAVVETLKRRRMLNRYCSVHNVAYRDVVAGYSRF